MTYLIKATDTSGLIRLHRDTREGAMKKASELRSDGCWDVEVIEPQVQQPEKSATVSLSAI